MNVKKEVYDKCRNMIEAEFRSVQHKLFLNKHQINNLAKEQRVLKATLGKLHELKKGFKI